MQSAEEWLGIWKVRSTFRLARILSTRLLHLGLSLDSVKNDAIVFERGTHPV
jgi:hypothetical protein